MRTIITGAASGIGAALAKKLVSDPKNSLLLTDRDTDGLASVCAELGDRAVYFTADLSDPASAAAIVIAAVDKLGGIDALASNAGIFRSRSLNDTTADEFDRTFAINTRPTWLLAKAAYPHLVAAGGGSIVATASISATHATPAAGAYSPSKAALLMMVRQLASEWGPDGIRCNTVSPGPTLTPMTAEGYADEQRRRSREAAIPLRRLGSADDVASVIAFLLSDSARYVTGVDLLVDGGLSTTVMSGSGAGTGQSGAPA